LPILLVIDSIFALSFSVLNLLRANSYPLLRWCVVALLVVLAWFVPQMGNRWFGPIERLASRWARNKRMTVISVALVAIMGRLALFWAFPVPVPRIGDEFAYLLIGDTLAHGRLANPPHPMSLYLDTGNVLQHPTYASMFPPAQGAVLAVGILLGHPWIGVLLSMAAMCAVVTWMLQGWFPPKWALLGGVLVLLRLHFCCYWLETYWGGAVAALGGALVLGALPRLIRWQRFRDSVLMGIGICLLANSRPLEGAIFCIPVAVALCAWLISKRVPSPSIRVRGVLLPLSCMVVLTVAFVAYYNWKVTGSALLMPHMLYQREYINYPIFIWQSIKPPLHYANKQFDDGFNVWVRSRFRPSWQTEWAALKGWWVYFIGGSSSLLLVVLPCLLRDRRIRLLLAQFFFCAVGLLVVIYFEPHYAAPLAVTTIALLVQAMRHLRRWQIRSRPVGIFLTRMLVLLALARDTVIVVDAGRNPVNHSWNLDRAQIAKQLEATPGKHLVLVHYEPTHFFDQEWVYNAADIDGSKIVWAREIPEVDLEPLIQYFKDRKVWEVVADAQPAQLQPYRLPIAAPGPQPHAREPVRQAP